MTTRQEDPRDDGQLLAAVADHDADALGVLYDRHAAWLLLRLRRRCTDQTLVDEVLQDTFLSVWRDARRFRGGAVGAWIWTIASRRLVDGLRASHSRHRLLDRLLRRSNPVESSAEDQVLVGLAHSDLAPALNRLSPELRAVIQATVLDGLSTAEAAELLGIPRNTVKTRAMRARVQLRRSLT
ncbi:RNA polymerase sigma factor [Longispora urticae]